MKTIPNLGAVLDKVAREAIGKDWALYGALLQHWPEIVGLSYAKNTAPVKVVFPRGKKKEDGSAQAYAVGGTLTIRAPKGLAMELSFALETIRTRINGFFGYPAIGKVQIEASYAPPPAPPSPPARALSANERSAIETATRAVENEELRKALDLLGASILLDSAKE